MPVIFAPLVLAAATVAAPTFNFRGLSAISDERAVKEKFPMAKVNRRQCHGASETMKLSDGVYKCEELYLENYDLLGYKFEIDFIFYEDGGLSVVGLNYPKVSEDDGESSLAVDAAFENISGQFLSKYGKHIAGAPCELAGELCYEWQGDRSPNWRAGGERISLKLDQFPSHHMIMISYKFADVRSFGKF